MRSTLISGCFVAYGIGCIALNTVTLFVKSANWLAATATFLVYATTIPSFFSYKETPKYLYNSGQFSELMDNLYQIAKRNGKNITKSEFYEEFMEKEEYNQLVEQGKMIKIKSFPKKQNKKEDQISPFKELFSNRT